MVRLIQEKQKNVRHEGNVKSQSPHKEKCKLCNEREKTAFNFTAYVLQLQRKFLIHILGL
jgi:hypothetical protein